ncbi:VOC family protein [Nocardia sp. NBC_01499]|uniref:VOC family protein n=1 Tax=Nocardia sp. NBC_01499 TaxID=2903597 RepID=UPI00386A0FF6
MVDDVDATAAFYEAAFGLGTVFADPDGTFVVLGRGVWTPGPSTPSLTIEHWKKIEDFAEPGPANAFRVLPETTDVDALAAGANSALIPTTRPWGQRVAVVHDPNGVIVEIGAPIG